MKKCVWCGSEIEINANQEIQSEAYCASCITKFRMICPVCSSVAMFHQDGEDKSSSYFGYYCPQCKGIWYNTDVLEFRPDGSIFFIRYHDNSS